MSVEYYPLLKLKALQGKCEIGAQCPLNLLDGNIFPTKACGLGRGEGKRCGVTFGLDAAW